MRLRTISMVMRRGDGWQPGMSLTKTGITWNYTKKGLSLGFLVVEGF